jgi:uncharacterized protein
VKLDAIYIYPIKSCAGISVEQARVTRRGLEHDRRWMVTDERGLFLTQRTLPAMQRVRLAVGDGELIATRDGLAPLRLPSLTDDGPRIEVEVWEQRVPAVRHAEGSEWLTRALGRAVQLVCMPDDVERPVKPPLAREGDVVSFADGYPLLVINRASLEDLCARAGLPPDARRFRPNLAVAGARAWAEDDWRSLRVGGVRLRLPKPCARCTIPGLDPDTTEATKEPLRTLATFRKRDHEVYFGVNAIAQDGDEGAILRVGDEVEVI